MKMYLLLFLFSCSMIEGKKDADLILPLFLPPAVKQWPGGVIPYAVDGPNESDVNQAASAWNGKTKIRFVKRTGEANYIVLKCSLSPYSYYGMTGGAQTVSVRCPDSQLNIIHELGHVIGLTHEHQRRDRGAFINVRMENVKAGHEQDFYTDSYPLRGAYDKNSVMHYSENDWSVNGQPTIEFLNGAQVRPAGYITALDAEKVNNMY